jgi:hypothetical protein
VEDSVFRVRRRDRGITPPPFSLSLSLCLGRCVQVFGTLATMQHHTSPHVTCTDFMFHVHRIDAPEGAPAGSVAFVHVNDNDDTEKQTHLQVRPSGRTTSPLPPVIIVML